jgi:hypothetical protein
MTSDLDEVVQESRRVTILRRCSLAVLALALVLCGVWAGLFLWFQMPGGPAVAGCASALCAAATLAALVAVFRHRWIGLGAYAAAFAALALWFASIQPRNDRDWASDVARPLAATIDGSSVTIHDVRNFKWRTETEGDPAWEERRYDLSQIESVDLINSYWTGPAIAHTLVSFGFKDGRHLAFSAEIRHTKDEEFSSLAGFFKRFELIFVAADERDIVRVRTEQRHENVQIFRIKATQDQIRRGFLAILTRANDLIERPAFYGTLDRNCTTVMVGAAREIAPGLPLDWRILASGYLPDYAYDQGLLDRRFSLAELRQRGSASARGIAAGDAADFSARIRAGIPDPNR